MILLIDNYDSFTYNLADLLQRFVPVKILRNDVFSLAEIAEMMPTGIVISPGPGKPRESGVSYEVVQHFWGKLPILGVCLGHQIMAEIAGAEIVLAEKPMHGKISRIVHDEKGIFEGISNPLQVMRYHSLLVKKDTLPSEMQVTAWTDTGEIMAMQHKTLPLTGVQFHPESILTEYGEKMMRNWLRQLAVSS